MARAHVLVVDDQERVRQLLAGILGEAHEVTTAADAATATALLGAAAFDVVLTDVRMSGASGFDLLETVRRVAPGTSVVMMAGFASVPDAVAAMRRGAVDYVAKPLAAEAVRLAVRRALERRGGAALRSRAAAPGGPPAEDRPPPAEVSGGFKASLLAARDQASRGHLVALMQRFHGNVTRAADHARMTRENLHRLLRKHRVRSEDFRSAVE